MVAFFHILVPVICTIVLTIVMAQGEPITITYVFFVGGGYLCAPYAGWLIIHLLAKPGAAVVHAGYIGVTTAMVIIGGLIFFPSGNSILGFFWLAYWPLAGVLMLLFAGITHSVRNA